MLKCFPFLKVNFFSLLPFLTSLSFEFFSIYSIKELRLTTLYSNLKVHGDLSECLPWLLPPPPSSIKYFIMLSTTFLPAASKATTSLSHNAVTMLPCSRKLSPSSSVSRLSPVSVSFAASPAASLFAVWLVRGTRRTGWGWLKRRWFGRTRRRLWWWRGQWRSPSSSTRWCRCTWYRLSNPCRCRRSLWASSSSLCRHSLWCSSSSPCRRSLWCSSSPCRGIEPRAF